MGISSKNILKTQAFTLIFAVVAVAIKHLPKRTETRRKIAATRVVLKTNDGGATTYGVKLEHKIANHAFFGANAMEVEGADEGKLATIPSFIIIAQHLVATTDGKESFILMDEIFNSLIFAEFFKIVHEKALLEVLPATDKEKVVFFGINRRAKRQFSESKIEAARLEAIHQSLQIAAVAIKIKQVGIEVT